MSKLKIAKLRANLPIYQITHLPMSSLGFFEVLILKNIGGGADQAEADAHLTGVTGREGITAQHHYFMRIAVRAIVYHLINTCFFHGFTGAEDRAGAASFAGVRTRLAASFYPGKAA